MKLALKCCKLTVFKILPLNIVEYTYVTGDICDGGLITESPNCVGNYRAATFELPLMGVTPPFNIPPMLNI